MNSRSYVYLITDYLGYKDDTRILSIIDERNKYELQTDKIVTMLGITYKINENDMIRYIINNRI